VSSLKRTLEKMEESLFNELYPPCYELSSFISVIKESELSTGDINKVFKVAVAKRGEGKGALSKIKDVKDVTTKGLTSLKNTSEKLATNIKKMVDSGKITAEQAKSALEKYLLSTLEDSFGDGVVNQRELGESIYTSILISVTSRMLNEGISTVVGEHFVSTSKVIVESPLDGVMDRVKTAGKSLGKKTRILDRGKADISDLQNAWIAAGKPTDSDEIEDILKQAGFTSGEINRAFKSAGVDRSNDYDENIVSLGRIVKDLELTPFVLKYLERFGIKESVSLNEKVIADRDIRAMFVKLLTKNQPNYPDDHASSTSSIQQYVNKWEKELKRLDNDNEIPVGHEMTLGDDTFRWLGAQWKNLNTNRIAKKDVGRKLSNEFFNELNKPKVALIKEIVNFLSDRHGSPEWKQVVKGVRRIIDSSTVDVETQDAALRHLRDGTVMESGLFSMIDEFLCETGFGWEDLGYSPCIIENNMVSLKSTVGSNMLLEDFFSKVLESHVYGRRRK
jgi:hypothetical protein